MRETELRSVLDQVVDRVNQKLDQKTFFESMPKVKLCPKIVLVTNFFHADH